MSGKLIRAYSDFGVADATPQNYPALRHFFPCDQGAGIYGLRDVTRGVVLASLGLVAHDSYSVAPAHSDNRGHNLPLSQGAWSIPSDKVFILMGVGKFKIGAGIWIGDSLSQVEANAQAEWPVWSASMQTSGIGGGSVLAPGITGVISSSEPCAIGAVFRPNGKIFGFATSALGAYTKSADSASSIGPIPSFPSSCSFDGTTYLTALYGKAYFSFSDVPSDLETAVQWMRAAWARGTKAIYPGWRGRV